MARARKTNAGFTLVEVMVVLVISAVLVMVAVSSMREQIEAAQGMEALAMIQSIRSAEESFRASEGVYLDVTQNGWFPRNPSAGSGDVKRAFYDPPAGGGHPDNPRWLLLSPTVPGPVRCGYRVNAGLAGQAMTAPAFTVTGGLTWPTAGEPWYVIQAICDQDGDGTPGYYLASSLNTEVYSQGDGQ